MIWLYRILYLPALLAVLPHYGLRMWRRGGYGKDFQHRFGFFHRLAAPAAGKKRIWLQAVSVGEILAIGPLIKALRANDNIEIGVLVLEEKIFFYINKCKYGFPYCGPSRPPEAKM